MNLVTRKTCRICGSASLTPVLSLGDQFLASTFIQSDESNLVKRPIPLELVRCNPELDEKACGLVQLKHTVPPDLMYSSYWYESGINRTMTENLHGIARQVENYAGLKSGDFAIDIGCNDGTLLMGYTNSQIRKVGFEPSNKNKLAEAKGFEVINDFFNAAAFEHRYPGTKAKVITSIAMFYDLERPQDFVRDIAELLHKDGLWVAELSYLPSMLEANSFDTLCHEHLEYYHLAPIEHLLSAHGLRLVDVELNDVNGGSFRFFARHAHHGYLSSAAQDRVAALRKKEFEYAFETGAPWENFRKNCEKVRADLNSVINTQIRLNKKILLYGASTKGNTLLQYCDIGSDRIIAAAERNPIKFGLKTPGTNIPIISEEEARKQKPDLMLVLPWHFLAEFVHREADYLLGGGKFIIPLPEVRVIDQAALKDPAFERSAAPSKK